jgi:hypothetical protein
VATSPALRAIAAGAELDIPQSTAIPNPNQLPGNVELMRSSLEVANRVRQQLTNQLREVAAHLESERANGVAIVRDYQNLMAEHQKLKDQLRTAEANVEGLVKALNESKAWVQRLASKENREAVGENPPLVKPDAVSGAFAFALRVFALSAALVAACVGYAVVHGWHP